MSVEAAAAAAGYTKGHLSKVENGGTKPSEVMVIALDTAFDANGLLLSLYEEVLGDRRRLAYEAALSERSTPRPLMKEASAGAWLPAVDCELPMPGDASVFVGEGESPIGVLLERGTEFTKSWHVTNSGTVAWRDRFLRRVGPNAAATLVATDRAVRVPDAQPGETVLITVQCRAQWIESTSVAHFKMAFADGRLCWPDRYSHGLDLLVTSVRGPSCTCNSCTSIGPAGPKHRRAGPS